MKTIFLLIFLLTFGVHAEDFFAENVKPFLNSYCSDCHSDKKQKGKLNLDPIDGFRANLNSIELWQEIHDLLEEGDMPPEDEKQPTTDEKEKVMTWIAYNIDSKREEMNSAAFTHMRRLNRSEYDNTIRDLLKVDTDLLSPSRNFPVDGKNHNFANNGKALQVSDFHLKEYITAAQEVINEAVWVGEKPSPTKYVFKPPFYGNVNVLKVGAYLGKDKFLDLVEQRSFATSERFKNGVEHSGYYKITARVKSMNRVHKMDKDLLPVPQDQPLRASIVLTDAKSGDPAYFTTSDSIVGDFELPDEEETTISGTYWLNKGYSPKIGFPNSVTRFKPVKGGFLRKYPKLGKKLGWEKGIEGNAFQSFVVMQRYLQENGPQVRVYEFSVEGPIIQDWPPASHKVIFGDKGLQESNADEVIDNFAAKAYRRPLVDGENNSIKEMMSKLEDQGFAKEDVVKSGLAAVISSPQFMYLQEKSGQLDDYALASRLSYFLWSSQPDEELYSLARNGSLSQPEVLESQVRRMVKSPKLNNFVNNFADAWLQLDKLGTMPPEFTSSQIYYHNELDKAGRQETTSFILDLVQNNGAISNFLDSDYTFVNRGLAEFYGMKDFDKYDIDKFVKVPVVDKRRGGLLGQMGILTATANGVDTSPILRGVWFLENIQGVHLSAPPQVDAVEPDIRGAETLRQLLEKHRDDKSCSACHKKIDPPGFALENFDHIGRWRSAYNQHLTDKQRKQRGIEFTPVVDAKGYLTGGGEFNDIVGFKKLLLEDQEGFTENLANKLLTYATGREIRKFERDDIEKIVAAMGTEGIGLQDLLVNVVKSDMFKRK
ncbi:MAG: DUF1592 domain-containing protein [Lentisphaeraceae bacterium]|nr:DUF1592 domain-containing protein [Lentisphaeraceae bacterium]